MSSFYFYLNLQKIDEGFINSSEFKAFLEQNYAQGEFIDEFYLFCKEFVNSDFITVKTSGSTGEPKSYSVKKEYFINSAYKTIEYFNLKSHDEALLCMPVHYIAGKMMIIRAMLGHLSLNLLSPCQNPYLSFSKKIKFAPITPMMAKLAFENKQSSINILNTEHILIGGAPINDSLLSIIDRQSNNYYFSYGMTETLSHIAIRKLNGKDKDRYFKVLKNVQISKSDRGTLDIKAFDVNPNILHTNDLVNIYQDGFEILGRVDNVINTGGIKIQIEQVEAILANFITQSFAISSKKDDLLGEKVVLVLENKVDSDILDEAFANLSKYQRPKQIIYQAIPKAQSGKILRQKLYERLNHE